MKNIKIECIEGTVTLDDGTEIKFSVSSDGVWNQWGTETEKLSITVDLMNYISDAMYTANSELDGT